MIVFRTYLALLQKYWLIILSYAGVFLILILVIGAGSGTKGPRQFVRGSMNAALSMPAGGHEEGEAFASWLEEAGHKVSLVSFSTEEAQEAVFDHGYDAVFLFEPGQAAPRALTDRTTSGGYFALSVAETYFRYREAFEAGDGSYDQALFHGVLAQEMEVLLQEGSEAGSDDDARISFFSGFAYVLLLMSTTLVPLVGQSFSEPGLRSRTALSPYPAPLQALGMTLGSGLIVFGISTVLLLATLPVTRTLFVRGLTASILLNLFVFALAVLALSHLIASLIRNKVAITAVSTVLSLGMAFLSGAFVPQPLLGQVALTIAKGFPLYYYIHANLRIHTPASMTTDLVIQFAFALAYFLIAVAALRLSKRARRQTRVQGPS